MEIDEKYNGQVLVLKPLSGRIDASSSEEFKGKMLELIDKDGKLVVLNLSEVNFIDSSALGAIIAILKILDSRKGRLLLCSAKEMVANTFKVTHLDRLFPIYHNESQAVMMLDPSSNMIA